MQKMTSRSSGNQLFFKKVQFFKKVDIKILKINFCIQVFYNKRITIIIIIIDSSSLVVFESLSLADVVKVSDLNTKLSFFIFYIYFFDLINSIDLLSFTITYLFLVK